LAIANSRFQTSSNTTDHWFSTHNSIELTLFTVYFQKKLEVVGNLMVIFEYVDAVDVFDRWRGSVLGKVKVRQGGC
jgi:hypothetical protein